MISQELKYQILHAFAFEPTPEQDAAIRTFCDFLIDRDPMAVMVMRGSAGTGKTALASAIVRALTTLKQQLLLLAPTGRAAKVFSLNSGHDAYTIHRRIYRQETFTGEMTGFQLNFNQYHDMLVMVDEASMIANDSYGEAAFGSGRLLDDLVKYVYSGQNCRMMLIGDRAQLPPVGEEESPALLADVLRGYGLKVYECDLNQVLRQSEQSGILYNATVVRQMITRDEMTQLPQIRFQGFPDIRMVPGDELIESLNSSYSRVGMDETIVITRSNKRANIYNHGIRNTVLGREEQLSTGDSLMVVRNNYYWSEQEKAPFPFIANGDRMRVLRVRHQRELYGFHFADAILSFPDYDDYELSCTVMLDTLTTEAPALTREQNDQLFAAVQEDYADVAQKAERMKKIRVDSYYNALQIKFAYAVTCHKAQGGQWEHVYVDQGYMTDDMLTNDYIHWLYTAFTRATDTLFLVNWPKTQTES
jgi:ATP-dependent exoDNAse (exonuclease V) alpha subunit